MAPILAVTRGPPRSGFSPGQPEQFSFWMVARGQASRRAEGARFTSLLTPALAPFHTADPGNLLQVCSDLQSSPMRTSLAVPPMCGRSLCRQNLGANPLWVGARWVGGRASSAWGETGARSPRASLLQQVFLAELCTNVP